MKPKTDNEIIKEIIDWNGSDYVDDLKKTIILARESERHRILEIIEEIELTTIKDENTLIKLADAIIQKWGELKERLGK
jgi:Asp-tRNA(Asn)/Glu-tRNA(Gln) amidotransferase B subunit